MRRFLLILFFIPLVGIAKAGTIIFKQAGDVNEKIKIIQNRKSNFIINNVVSSNDSIAPDTTGMGVLNSVDLAKEMVIGWNVGNSLDAIGGETAWGNPLISQRLIDSVKAAGFNAIRIPVAWSSHFSNASTFTIDSAWMARVGQVVNYVLKDSMYAIINEHWDGGWMQPTYAQQTYVNNRLAVMWRQIAIHFRDYGDHLLFAGMNEVMVTNNYNTPTVEYYTVQNSFNQTFVTTVRSTGGRNVYRYLVVQGFNTNIDYTVNYFVIPNDVTQNRLMVEVHYYDPYDFTLNTSSSITQWGKNAITASKTETWANESYADGQFQKMKTKFIDKGYAVILGEYGAIARLNLGSDALNAQHAEYRRYYIDYITQSIVKHELIPFYWDNGSTGDKSMGLFNRSTGAQAYPDIIKAIIDTIVTINAIPTASVILKTAEMLKVYPNPVKEVFNLEIEDKSINYCQLYNLDGQMIKTLDVDHGNNTYNISNLKAGLYFIQIPTSKGIITQKMVKE